MSDEIRHYINLIEGKITERIFYDGDFQPPYYKVASHIVILQNPSLSELNQFRKRVHDSNDLRAIIDDDLYVWDALVAEHSAVMNVFGLSGYNLYLRLDHIQGEDWYLSDPENKQHAIDLISKNKNIIRLYGQTTSRVHRTNLCFFPEN